MGGIIVNFEAKYEYLYEALIILMSMILVCGIASLIRTYMVKSYTRTIGPKAAIFIDSRLTFIGVIHHELSHMLLGGLVGARIKQFNLYKSQDGTLGHVDIIPRGPFIIKMIQKTMCGCAPVICGSISCYLLYYYNIYNKELLTVRALVSIILLMQISYHMSMSKQDVKVSLGGMWAIYLIMSLICYIIDINLEIYKEYIITILAIMCINLLVALLIKLIAIVFKRV